MGGRLRAEQTQREACSDRTQLRKRRVCQVSGATAAIWNEENVFDLFLRCVESSQEKTVHQVNVANVLLSELRALLLLLRFVFKIYTKISARDKQNAALWSS